MTNPVISIVSPDSATVFLAGRPFVVESDNPRYGPLVEALGAQDWDRVEDIINAANRLTRVLGKYGDVTVYAGQVSFQGRPVKNHLVDRILTLVDRGQDPGPYALFLDRVMRNPTRDAIEMLFDWVERANLPILPDGRFLAVRYVNQNYLDCHTQTMDNTPGRIIEMPRSDCDTNYNNTCSRGLHFCNISYLSGGSGQRYLVMAEDPADVVSFPQDSGGSKGRTQRHEALFEVTYRDLINGEVFRPGELVFPWERVAELQREGLKMAPGLTEEVEDILAAWDAGWRVRWNQGPWEVIDPNGKVVNTFEYRSPALDYIAEQFEISEPEPQDVSDEAAETFAGRLARLETTLRIVDADPNADFAVRLDRIEVELGLSPGAPPQIDRLRRAERLAGI